jgi:hypothetical protein
LKNDHGYRNRDSPSSAGKIHHITWQLLLLLLLSDHYHDGHENTTYPCSHSGRDVRHHPPCAAGRVLVRRIRIVLRSMAAAATTTTTTLRLGQGNHLCLCTVIQTPALNKTSITVSCGGWQENVKWRGQARRRINEAFDRVLRPPFRRQCRYGRVVEQDTKYDAVFILKQKQSVQ